MAKLNAAGKVNFGTRKKGKYKKVTDRKTNQQNHTTDKDNERYIL